MKIEFTVWKVEDAHGNTDGGTINEEYDTVQVCGMKNKEGKSQYFESDFRHLGKWCEENNITLDYHLETCTI